MQEPAYATTAEQRRAHDTVTRLRHLFAELGLADDQVRQILPVTDMQRRAYVRLGTLTVDGAEKVADAIERAMERTS
ncbi:hypothetical protein ACFZAM_02965 [Streptomyces sp. NPDC008079]|uniref:hypothetical protein n=1 Tax=Streptomyces sp. NPDC008079 TaxID=3364806 RepID=UPI0036EA1489